MLHLNKNQTSQSIKPFCKVCKDAGKSESEYTSHFVKSQDGNKIICPTLLSQECRYCFKSGHTVKFCQVLLKKKNEEARVIKTKSHFEDNNKQSKQKQNQNKNQNIFSIIAEEDDNESKEEFPALNKINSITNVNNTNTITYASLAAKPKPCEIKTKAEEEVKKTKTVLSLKLPSTLVKKSWADWSDSEDEEEQEELYNKNSHDKYNDNDW